MGAAHACNATISCARFSIIIAKLDLYCLSIGMAQIDLAWPATDMSPSRLSWVS